MAFTVAIVGRPNVGKSTLFNRLVGQRVALVDDTPGVTRDRRLGEGRLGDLVFRLYDTAGLEEAFDDSLEARMRAQTGRAVGEADAVLMLIDARAGVTPLDGHFAAWLRRLGKPTVLVANKCEGRAGAAGLAEAYALGLGDPLPVSAEHGEGMGLLYDALAPLARAAAASDGEAAAAEEDEAAFDPEAEVPEDDGRPIRLAVVGRPNVGKSTLVNRLIGEERLLTGPEPGITRDAIEIPWEWQGRAFRLIDTAGLRRRARVSHKLEKLSAADTLRAVRFAQVVALVVDATQPFERQDLTIARLVVEEGRALVVACNKWDLVEDRAAAQKRLREQLEAALPQVRGVPFVTLSALEGRRLDRLMDAVVAAYRVWNRRVKTSPLNRWLGDMLELHPPPLVKGRRLKVRYATQVKARPPTFALFSTRPAEIPDSYIRYLVNGLREHFDLPGTPIRIVLRKGENPYARR